MTDSRGSSSTQAVGTDTGGAEHEVRRLREAERESRRQAEVLKRHAQRLAAATSPHEVAETTMLEVKALGVTVAELTSPAETGLVVMASIGLTPEALTRIASATLADDLPAATAMRTNGPVSIRPESSPVAAYPPSGGDSDAEDVGQILAWPLHGEDGSILGALSVGLPEPVGPSESTSQILVALVEQTGLALGRALQSERRREVELELIERHRMVTELTALVPGLLYVHDLARPRTTFVNRQAAQILGYTDSELSELAVDGMIRLVHPDDAEVVREHLAAVMQLADGESRQVQFRIRHGEGAWRWWQGRDSVLRRDATGRVVEVIGVATDVTEEKRAEEARRARAERDRFKADLADALREVEVPADAQRVATRLLGEHLGATRVHYATVSDDGAEGIVEDGHWEGASALRGSFQFDRYGPAVMSEFRAGRTIRIDDVAGDERLTPSERQATMDLGVAAYVMVPLMRTGRPVAVLVVHQDRPRRWAPEEVEVIEETAERTAATVERALAMAALAEREVRYRSLFTSIDEGFCLCEIVTDADGHPIDYRFLEVNPRFEEKTGLVAPVGRCAREMVPDLEDHWVQTMGRVALKGETVRYENRAEGLNRWFDVYAAPVEPVGGGRFVVVVNDVTERRQAEETLRDAAERARRGRSRTELVDSVMSDLEAIDHLAPLAARLVETLIPQLADYAILEVPGRSRPVLAIAHHDPAKLPVLSALREEYRLAGAPTSIIVAAGGEARLVEHVSPELLREVSADDARAMALLAELGPRSHIAVPVDVSGEAGALLLGLSDPSRPAYGPDELALAQEIAGRVSVLFAHARVREDEHAIGVRLQKALLPAQLLEHPAAQLAARYQTGSDLLYVGGDWYDTVALPGGRICLAVGDVVGHGLDAAASMSRLRIALAALAPDADSPGELLSRLGEFATGANGVQFATAACAFLAPETGELEYTCAGHPPPLVVSVDGQTEWLEGGRSTPIGSVSLASARPDASHRLKPGDVLILYSDGLVERRRETISVGLARLEASARRLVDEPIDVLCERLMDELTTTSTTDDDAVLLCLRFSPVTEQLFQRRIPAHARELAPTRAAIRIWLKARQYPASVGHRLLLTVGEAMTNAIEHGYHGQSPGVIDLSIRDPGDDALHVEVRDHGRWREVVDRPGRGYGGRVIRGLSTGVQRQSGSEGTTLTFDIPINTAV